MVGPLDTRVHRRYSPAPTGNFLPARRDAIDEVDDRGNRLVDDTVLMLLIAHHEPISFILPVHRPKVRWELVLDTGDATRCLRQRARRGGEPYDLEARSPALLRLRGNDAIAS